MKKTKQNKEFTEVVKEVYLGDVLMMYSLLYGKKKSHININTWPFLENDANYNILTNKHVEK